MFSPLTLSILRLKSLKAIKLQHDASCLNFHHQEVANASEGVPVIAYSAALARFPLPHLFTTLFFILFFLIGLDTVFQSHETLLSVFKDASRWANGRKGQVSENPLGFVCFFRWCLSHYVLKDNKCT